MNQQINLRLPCLPKRPQIYEYQGCQAAQDLLRGQEGETLSTANDQRSLNIRGRLFERFFSLLHVTNVASNGEHLNRECSLFTDDCRYVIVGSATYVPEDPPPYFFEVAQQLSPLHTRPSSFSRSPLVQPGRSLRAVEDEGMMS